ncbi:hypothetical protein [Pseudoalteromonas sp. S3431]|uniref:hypothetical protein n=1 Tax=Pseudoalteromonas sp. S3431 TaxID=579537 RepID=UPI0004A0FAD8|nr:hypothetical protein [Pseudoalteromonas sp. S3431]KDC49699.1 hypothetical protein DO88_18830 [Pseudoalteromonas sp. S3431]
MYEQVEKPKENQSRAIANNVGQKKSNVLQGFVDNRPEAVVQRELQKVVTYGQNEQQIADKSNVVQRLVVQSDWLRQGAENIETATSSSGPWKECTDKTSAGYRDNAEKSLGTLDGLNALAKHSVIPPATMSGRGPLAKAHLIAAEFGGQLKFSPVDNIRYHPLDVEYGQWQLDENDVGKAEGRGYITSRSSELGVGIPYLMSLDIGDIVEKEYGFSAGYHVSQQFEPWLQAAASVPISVAFKYTNVDNPYLNISHSWGGIRSVLKVQAVSAKNVFGAMLDLGLELPDSVVFDESSNDAHISSREQMISLIVDLGIKGKSLINLYKKINSLKKLVTAGTIPLNDAIDAINKHPYLATKPGKWILAGNFSTWADLN